MSPSPRRLPVADRLQHLAIQPAADRAEPAPEPTRVRDPRNQGPGPEQSLASLATTRLVLNAVLAMPCPEGHAPAHGYCYAGTRGICRVRYERGREEATGSARPTGALRQGLDAPASPPTPPRDLDFRHPNRQWGGRR